MGCHQGPSTIVNAGSSLASEKCCKRASFVIVIDRAESTSLENRFVNARRRGAHWSANEPEIRTGRLRLGTDENAGFCSFLNGNFRYLRQNVIQLLLAARGERNTPATDPRLFSRTPLPFLRYHGDSCYHQRGIVAPLLIDDHRVTSPIPPKRQHKVQRNERPYVNDKNCTLFGRSLIAPASLFCPW